MISVLQTMFKNYLRCSCHLNFFFVRVNIDLVKILFSDSSLDLSSNGRSSSKVIIRCKKEEDRKK